jgi:hypothetical protein
MRREVTPAEMRLKALLNQKRFHRLERSDDRWHVWFEDDDLLESYESGNTLDEAVRETLTALHLDPAKNRAARRKRRKA